MTQLCQLDGERNFPPWSLSGAAICLDNRVLIELFGGAGGPIRKPRNRALVYGRVEGRATVGSVGLVRMLSLRPFAKASLVNWSKRGNSEGSRGRQAPAVLLAFLRAVSTPGTQQAHCDSHSIGFELGAVRCTAGSDQSRDEPVQLHPCASDRPYHVYLPRVQRPAVALGRARAANSEPR